jgi:hypothetical protein
MKCDVYNCFNKTTFHITLSNPQIPNFEAWALLCDTHVIDHFTYWKVIKQSKKSSRNGRRAIIWRTRMLKLIV